MSALKEVRKTQDANDPKKQIDGVQFTHTSTANNGEKRIIATRENLECLISYYGIGVAYDVIKKRPIVTGIKSLVGEEENTVIAFLKSRCSLNGLSKAIVDDQLQTVMRDNAKNPVTQWLSSIQRTSSHNPVNKLIDSIPVKNKEWVKVAFYRWLIQCVAAADITEHSGNPKALPKYESVLTFYGDQGLQKTTFMRALLPQGLKSYLKDGMLLDLANKDSVTGVLSSWMTELGELDSTFKKSDISALKAFLSKQEDEIRRPYARANSIMPRQTSFFASVNEEKFLRDITGNRRYLPITVIGELMLPSDFDATDLWAFTWDEYKRGAQWWLTKDEEVLQQSALKSHEDSLFEDMLMDEFDFDTPAKPDGITGNDILDLMHVARSRSNSTNLGVALKKLGVEKSGRLYLLPPTRRYRNL